MENTKEKCCNNNVKNYEKNIFNNNILVTNGIIHKEMVEEFKNYLN